MYSAIQAGPVQDCQAWEHELGEQLCEDVLEGQEDREDPGLLEGAGEEGVQQGGQGGSDQSLERRTAQLHVFLCLP